MKCRELDRLIEAAEAQLAEAEAEADRLGLTLTSRLVVARKGYLAGLTRAREAIEKMEPKG
jgi:hypothetical protein